MHVAADGHTVLDLAQRVDPDGCVLDVLMPGADGREVLRRLRADGRWLPVILLTQVGESRERAIALDEGADDYLNEPFDPYELLARLRAVLRRARPGRRPLSASPALRAGDLRMDRISRRAWLGDRGAHAHAEGTLSGGTGRYKGISGSGHYSLNVVEIQGRANGNCSPSRPPAAFQQVITASGPVKRL